MRRFVPDLTPSAAAPRSESTGKILPQLIRLLEAGSKDSRGGSRVESLITVLEGVLVDTVPADLRSLRITFSDAGYHILPSLLYARIEQNIFEVLLDIAIQLGFQRAQITKLHQTFACAFDACVPLVGLNTWIVDMLQESSDYVRLVLVSERTQAAVRSILDHHSLDKLFSHCEMQDSSREETARAVLLRRVLRNAELNSMHCAVIGPSFWAGASAQVGAKFLDVREITQAGSACTPVPSQAEQAQTGSSPRGSATVRDVARKAGVSTATVSRAFNQPDAVSEECRKRVFRAVRETGYVPNYFARILGRRSKR